MPARIWYGPSQFTGEDIIVLLTGHTSPSHNEKTGPMMQTWILHGDESPADAIHAGTDSAVCGTCKHRGDGFKQRSCYVNIRGPQAVWKARDVDLPAKLPNRGLRLGAYGDPAAVPFEVWHDLITKYKILNWTGYTHAWETCDQRLQYYCMASVDTEHEARSAQQMGWRTFRVGLPYEEPQKDLVEILCPASEEAGFKTTCSQCLACGGTQSMRNSSIYIPIHGTQVTRRAFARKVQPQAVASTV